MQQEKLIHFAVFFSQRKHPASLSQQNHRPMGHMITGRGPRDHVSLLGVTVGPAQFESGSNPVTKTDNIIHQAYKSRDPRQNQKEKALLILNCTGVTVDATDRGLSCFSFDLQQIINQAYKSTNCASAHVLNHRSTGGSCLIRIRIRIRIPG